MDLATLCDTYVEVQMTPMDAIWLFLVKVKTYPAAPSPTL